MLILFYLEGEGSSIQHLINIFESKTVQDADLLSLTPVIRDIIKSDNDRVIISVRKGKEMLRIFKSKRGAKIDRIPVIAMVREDVIKKVFYIENDIDELEIAKAL